MKEYIDVRGPYPIYFYGCQYARLEGYSRSITLDEVRLLIASGKVDFN